MGKKEKDLKAQANKETDPAKKAELNAEAAKWGEGGSYRIAAHAVVGGLTGGNVQGALGAGASAGAAPLLDAMQANITQSLVDNGMSPQTAQGLAKALTGVTAAGIGAVASGGSAAGAVTALNGDMNNRQLHEDEYKRAKLLAKNKALQDKLSQLEGRQISAEELEGRIVNEIWRNSDAQRSKEEGGISDRNIRSLVGCGSLNCNGSQDTNYNDPTFNSQYSGPNRASIMYANQNRGYGVSPAAPAIKDLENCKQTNTCPIGVSYALAANITAGGSPILFPAAFGTTGVSAGLNSYGQLSVEWSWHLTLGAGLYAGAQVGGQGSGMRTPNDTGYSTGNYGVAETNLGAGRTGGAAIQVDESSATPTRGVATLGRVQTGIGVGAMGAAGGGTKYTWATPPLPSVGRALLGTPQIAPSSPRR